MRSFKSLLLSLFVIIMVFTFTPPKEASAGPYDNALDFYNKYKENILVYEPNASGRGYFYFGQRGKTRTSNTYYAILGFNYSVESPDGSVYLGHLNVPNYASIKNEVRSGGYTYSLWGFDVDDLIENLRHHNPSVDFSFIYDKYYDTQWTFNSIVVIYDDGEPRGNIDKYGNKLWGNLLTGPAQAWPSWISQAEIRALFYISGPMPADKKPTTFKPTSFAMIPEYGRPNWGSPTAHYNDGNIRWVNLTNEFTVYTESWIPNNSNLGNIGYPDYTRVQFDWDGGVGAMNKYVSTIHSQDYDINSGFDSQFEKRRDYMSVVTTGNQNWLVNNYIMRARNHGMTYRVSHYSGKGGAESIPSTIPEIIKTDGYAPQTTWEQSSKFTSMNGLDLQQNFIYDNDSGVWDASVYALVFPNGSSDKGGRLDLYRNYPYQDYYRVIDLSDHSSSKSTSWVVEIYASDNVENEGLISRKFLDRPSGLPRTYDVTLSGTKYTDEYEKIKWTTPDTTFTVTQNGDAFGAPPTGSQVDILPVGASPQIYYRTSMGIDDYWNPPENTSNIYRSENTYLMVSGMDYQGYYYATGEHKLAAIRNTDGTVFDVYGMTDNVDSLSNMYGAWATSDYRLGIDGTPPSTGEIDARFSADNSSLYFHIPNVTDSASGVNTGDKQVSYWVYPSWSTDRGYEYRHKVENGSISIGAYPDLFFGGAGVGIRDWIVEVEVRDNVGNVRNIKSDVVSKRVEKPVSTGIDILHYEYVDEVNRIKWVQVYNEFLITQSGYVRFEPPTASRITIGSSDREVDYDGLVYSTTIISKEGNNDIWYYPGNIGNFARATLQYLEPSAPNYSGEQYATGYHFLTAGASENGNIYNVTGRTERYNINDGGEAFGNIVASAYRLGVDARGPTYSLTKVGRDTVEIAFTDVESGFYNATVTRADGSAQTITTTDKVTINLNGSDTLKIRAVDNVGNVTEASHDNLLTVVTSSIKTEVVIDNGRKKLKVTADISVKNPIPNNTLTLKLNATGDGVPYTSGNTVKSVTLPAGTNSWNTSFMIDDVYNQPHGPRLDYSSDELTYSDVTITNIEDLDKAYSFALTSQFSNEKSATTEATASANFNSGRKLYNYTVYRTSDEDFRPVKEVQVSKGTLTGTKISMNSMLSGNYKIVVYMSDFNGNPSGSTTLNFKHIRPFKYDQMFLRVDAVKDIAWEKEVYPIDYNTSKFPLGSKYKFENNPIKLGYMVNYSVSIPKNHSISSTSIKYKFVSDTGEALTGYTGGLTFASSDSKEGTYYASQNPTLIISDERVYLKHFIPANATFKKSNGSLYSGDVTVKADVTLTRSNVNLTIGYDMYTITQKLTAYDDLSLDKQR